MITAIECATMHSGLTEQEIKDKFPWVISAMNEFASRSVLEESTATIENEADGEKPIDGKLKVFVFDFGDTPYITSSKQGILEHISSDIHDLKDESDELNYTITTKTMTEDEYADLPEWC